MMWTRIWNWIRGKEHQLEAPIDAAIQERVAAAPRCTARYLLVLLLLLLCAVGYWLHWRRSPASPPPSLTPVATRSGGQVYGAPQTPAMAKAIAKGSVRPRTTLRPLAVIDVDELPKEEQDKAPDVAPAAGPDNVVRPLQILATAIVPPTRGETHARTYVYPDGSVQMTLDPQREKFLAFDMKRIELEGRYGVLGNTIARGTARWIPMRMGDLHVGVEGSLGSERDGGFRTEGMVIFRYEPFRDSYR